MDSFMELPNELRVELSPDQIAKIQTARDYDTLKALLEKEPVIKGNFHPMAAHHFSGIALAFSGLFYQAHLLFRNALEMDDPKYKLNDWDHHNLHYDLSDLISPFIHHEKPRTRISEYGFEIDSLPFRFQEDIGFYISGFGYNVQNFDFKDVGREIGRERTLAHIHTILAETPLIHGRPHTASNCPYLELLR